MHNRWPLSTQLLTNNSQFSPQDLKLNHEALAILLKHGCKERYEQTFVLAGSEDLKTLLPRLKLTQIDDEAFILIRPYIHTMALNLKRPYDAISVSPTSFFHSQENAQTPATLTAPEHKP